jgi:hypothetical protein
VEFIDSGRPGLFTQLPISAVSLCIPEEPLLMVRSRLVGWDIDFVQIGSAYPEFELPDAGVLVEVEPCLGGGLLGGIFVDSGMVKVARSISKFGSSCGSTCVASAQRF